MSAVTAQRVAVAPGDGVVLRRVDAVAFITDVAGGRAAGAIEGFAGAEDTGVAIDAVTVAIEEAVADDREHPPIVLVSWLADGDGGDREQVRVIAFGGVEVCSDLPELPMIGGEGSATWVERRLAAPDHDWSIWAGEEASDDTDLTLGRVRGGGFRIAVARSSPTAVRPDPPARTDVVGVADESGVADGASVLDAAGGDWMEDSLGLGPAAPVGRKAALPASPESPTASTSAEPAAAGEATDVGGAADDEMTLDPTQVGVPQWPAPASEIRSPTGPGDDLAGTDPDVPEATGARGPRRSRVAARKCRGGHPNPPERVACLRCRAPLDPNASVESIEQPVLGTLRLPDDSLHPIDRALVLGRSPTADAARTDGTVVAIDGPPAISRTHLVVRAEGWTITVTDCASRSGTAVAAADADAITLEPWVAHEASVGSRVFVGGPTTLIIEAVDDEYWYG